MNWLFRVDDIRELAFKRPDLVIVCPDRKRIQEALERGERLPGVTAVDAAKESGSILRILASGSQVEVRHD